MAELVRYSDARNTLVHWPELVDERLNMLLALTEQEGEQASRAQLLAALVCQAPADGQGLGVMIRTYRRLTVGQLEQELADVRLPRRLGPGRPRGTSASKRL
jgi:type VI protein secretion system component VasK